MRGHMWLNKVASVLGPLWRDKVSPIDIKTNWRFTVRFTASVADTGGRLALWYHVYGSL